MTAGARFGDETERRFANTLEEAGLPRFAFTSHDPAINEFRGPEDVRVDRLFIRAAGRARPLRSSAS